MLGKIAALLVTTTVLVACGSDQPTQDPSTQEEEANIHASHKYGPGIQADLTPLRQATARYHDINAAIADGFVLGIDNKVKICVVHPTDPTRGAMGYHYSKQKLFDDVTINELEPEVLVYHTADDGSLELGAVEWVVKKEAWEAANGGPGAAPPKVYNVELTVINPTLNWYVAHAWIWKPNPAGMITDWNPDVSCP